MHKGSLFSTSLPVLDISSLFDTCHSNRWYLIVVLICTPWCLAMLSIFSCACWSSVCLLQRSVYWALLLIFWLGCFFILSLVLILTLVFLVYYVFYLVIVGPQEHGFPSPPLEAKSLEGPRGFLWPLQSHLLPLSPSFIQLQLHWPSALSHTLRHVPTSRTLPLLLPESPSMVYSHILPVSAQMLLSERSPLTTLVYNVPLPPSIPLYLPPTSFAFLNRDYHLLT